MFSPPLSSSSLSSSSSSLFFTDSESSSSQSDFTPSHSPLREEPVSLCILTASKTSPSTETGSDADSNATPRLSSSIAFPPVDRLHTHEEAGYDSDREARGDLKAAVLPRRKFSLPGRLRGARELSNACASPMLKDASVASRIAELGVLPIAGGLTRSNSPGFINLAGLAPYSLRTKAPAGLGLGLGLPPTHSPHTPRVTTTESVMDLPSGLQFPCLPFYDSPTSPSGPSEPSKPRLRPVVIEGLPSPIVLLPSPLLPRWSNVSPGEDLIVPLKPAARRDLVAPATALAPSRHFRARLPTHSMRYRLPYTQRRFFSCPQSRPGVGIRPKTRSLILLPKERTLDLSPASPSALSPTIPIPGQLTAPLNSAHCSSNHDGAKVRAVLPNRVAPVHEPQFTPKRVSEMAERAIKLSSPGRSAHTILSSARPSLLAHSSYFGYGRTCQHLSSSLLFGHRAGSSIVDLSIGNAFLLIAEQANAPASRVAGRIGNSL
jgi:hypothetical protein